MCTMPGVSKWLLRSMSWYVLRFFKLNDWECCFWHYRTARSHDDLTTTCFFINRRRRITCVAQCHLIYGKINYQCWSFEFQRLAQDNSYSHNQCNVTIMFQIWTDQRQNTTIDNHSCQCQNRNFFPARYQAMRLHIRVAGWCMCVCDGQWYLELTYCWGRAATLRPRPHWSFHPLFLGKCFDLKLIS